MSIWGKIIGATTGFAVGGPIGALVGGFAGHVIDRRRIRQDESGGDATKQIVFTIGVIALGAKMAKADGQVTADEVQAFKEVFRIPPEEMKNVARVFDLARKDVRGYEVYAQQIAELFKENPRVLEDLVDGLFYIAKADNIMHPAELEYLKEVSSIFGFDANEFSRIKEAHLGPDQADPYQVLGVARDTTDVDIKQVYRRLIREHHPDALIAQGVPEEFVQVANGKLAAINVAYEQIEKERGLA